jgi:hypothetical protein
MKPHEPEVRLTAGRWRQVEPLFLATCERGPGERATVLEQACGTDVALRHQVESLLAADQGATGFLEPPEVPTPMMPDLETALRTELAGRYTVQLIPVHVLGRFVGPEGDPPARSGGRGRAPSARPPRQRSTRRSNMTGSIMGAAT